MQKFIKIIVTISILTLSKDIFALSCAGFVEEYYFSCRDSQCNPEFQIGFKKAGDACSRRPIVLDINKKVGVYLKTEIEKSDMISENGIFKLLVYFEYWSYQPSTNVSTLKNVIDNEYNDYLSQPKDHKISSDSIHTDLILGAQGVAIEYVDVLESNKILDIKQNKIREQYFEFSKYVMYIVIYWGSFLICLTLLVYSINRFYSCFNSGPSIDKRSLFIQLGVLIICISSLVTLSWNVWIGVLLLPVVVVLLIAESWLIIRLKISKS